MELTQNKKLIQLAISALLALMFVNLYLKSKERTIENSFSMVAVLAAAKDIPPRTVLNSSMLTVKEVPIQFIEPGAIMVKYPGQEIDKIKGKITVVSIPEGAQISQSNLM